MALLISFCREKNDSEYRKERLQIIVAERRREIASPISCRYEKRYFAGYL